MNRPGDLGAGKVGIAGGAPTRDWLYTEGALAAAGAGEEVVPASEYRALQQRACELQRLLGMKTLENEILREALDPAQPKKAVARALAAGDDAP